MLNSIIAGKAGRIPTTIQSGQSWREIVGISEDILTDLVFTRLSYLEPSLFWKVLRIAFKLPTPNYRVAKLKSINFWPNLENATNDGLRVEPDCHLTFELGDPGRMVSVLLESKLGDHGNPQSALQWHREWQAYEHWVKDDECEIEETYFLALGGVGDNPAQTVTALKATAKQMGSDVPAYGASWSGLTQVLDNIDFSSEREGRILEDINSALAIAGHRSIRALETLDPLPLGWCPVNHFHINLGQ